MALADALTLKEVRALAGDKAFARGTAYFQYVALYPYQEGDDVVRVLVLRHQREVGGG